MCIVIESLRQLQCPTVYFGNVRSVKHITECHTQKKQSCFMLCFSPTPSVCFQVKEWTLESLNMAQSAVCSLTEVSVCFFHILLATCCVSELLSCTHTTHTQRAKQWCSRDQTHIEYKYAACTQYALYWTHAMRVYV